MSKRHKYGVSPKEERTCSGIVFHSKRECLRYQALSDRVLAGEVFDLELQPKFTWETTHEARGRTRTRNYSYRADFRYTNSDGETIIEDVKGFKTAEYKRKKKIVEYLYEIEITET